ncbi:MAG: FHA domain-containing protein, partial [Litorilinea sp.]
MAQRDQLEIISPSGELIFFELDLDNDGIINLGSDPSNDVVLPGPGVADFHLVLDTRQSPIQVALIADNAEAFTSGTPLRPGQYQPLQAWDSVEAGGYTILLVEGSAADTPAPGTSVPTAAPQPPSTPPPSTPTATPSPSSTPPSPTPTGTGATGVEPRPSTEDAGFAAAGAAAVAGAGVAAAAGAATREAMPDAQGRSPDAGTMPGTGGQPTTGGQPGVTGAANGTLVRAPGNGLMDITSEEIVLSLEERNQEINVEEIAGWTLGMANGGELVARFDVHLEGAIDGRWVSIAPASVNLNEGGRGSATITIQPPRAPVARAGIYPLALVVTSPTYPEARAQLAVNLTILPYDDFNVGDVSPRQQSVSYFRKSGQLAFPLQNRSNHEAAFRIDGIDDENEVTFEFEVPGHDSRLVRQAELRLEPGQTVTLPVTVIPHQHRVIGVMTHIHALTLTTTQVESPLTPQSVMAQVRNRPIVGPWIITAMMVLLALILIITLQPRIDDFDFAPGLVETAVAAEAESSGVSATGIAGSAADLQGARLFGLRIPRIPRLRLPRQLNFVNDLLPTVPDAGAGEPVVVAPVSSAMVDAGNEVTLTWDTTRAATLTLEKLSGGQVEFLASIDNPGVVRQYTFMAERREAATYILTARNWIERVPFVGETFGVDESRLALIVDPVQPRINVFEVSTPSLVTGQPVEVTWQVERAVEYELLINGVPRPLDQARGSVQEVPGATTEYQLVARSPYWDDPIVSAARVVAVALPTPVIRNFDIDPRPI